MTPGRKGTGREAGRDAGDVGALRRWAPLGSAERHIDVVGRAWDVMVRDGHTGGGPGPDEAPKLEPSKALAGKTVLVADDEERIRQLVTVVLQQVGCRVLIGEDGEEGWEVLQEELAHGRKVDLLISDVVMPKLGGVPLAERATELLPDLPILFISGHFDVELPAGTSLLGKPFSKEALLARAAEAVKGRRVE